MIAKRFLKGDEVKVTFGVNVETDVEGVSLVCEATDWKPLPMEQTSGGDWRIQVRLPIDRDIQFRYLASGGVWLNDSEADSYIENSHGSDNSVIDTRRI